MPGSYLHAPALDAAICSHAVQGLFIAILTVAGVLKTVDDGKNLQNFLICVEMLPAALGMLYAFPYTEYKGAGAHSAFVFFSKCYIMML